MKLCIAGKDETGEGALGLLKSQDQLVWKLPLSGPQVSTYAAIRYLLAFLTTSKRISATICIFFLSFFLGI